MFNNVELADGQTLKIAELRSADGGADYQLRPSRISQDFPGSRLFVSDPMTVGGFRRNQSVAYSFGGVTFEPRPGLCWKHTTNRTPRGGGN